MNIFMLQHIICDGNRCKMRTSPGFFFIFFFSINYSISLFPQFRKLNIKGTIYIFYCSNRFQALVLCYKIMPNRIAFLNNNDIIYRLFLIISNFDCYQKQTHDDILSLDKFWLNSGKLTYLSYAAIVYT